MKKMALKWKRVMVALAALSLLLGMNTFVVQAHSCSVELLEGTKLLFAFSDGTTMKGAKIIVKDRNGEKLGTSKTDKEGIYDYAEYADTAGSIIGNDGEGHMCTYEVPEDAQAAVEDKTEAGEVTGAEEGSADSAETQKAEKEEKAEPTETPEIEEEKAEPTETPEAEEEKAEPTETPEAEEEKAEPTETPEAEEEEAEPTEAAQAEEAAEEESEDNGTTTVVIILVVLIAAFGIIFFLRRKK